MRRGGKPRWGSGRAGRQVTRARNGGRQTSRQAGAPRRSWGGAARAADWLRKARGSASCAHAQRGLETRERSNARNRTGKGAQVLLASVHPTFSCGSEARATAAQLSTRRHHALPFAVSLPPRGDANLALGANAATRTASRPRGVGDGGARTELPKQLDISNIPLSDESCFESSSCRCWLVCGRRVKRGKRGNCDQGRTLYPRPRPSAADYVIAAR